jgi:flagellar hook-associated protein 2
MDITSISNAAAAGRLLNARASSPGGTDKVAGALQLASKRIQQQRDTTSVQVSSFGKLQSSVADTQTAAKALSDPKQISTDADVKKVAGNFVTSFNNSIKASRVNIDTQTSARENISAKKADADLRQSVTKVPTVVADLKAIGITQQKDGSLAIDKTKFDAAIQSDATGVRSALDKLGLQVDKTATKQLASSGNIGSSVNSLNDRASRLASQQADQQARATAVQQNVSQQSSQVANSQSATQLYQRIFSL